MQIIFLTYTLFLTKPKVVADISDGTGKLEGFNNKIKVAKRIGYGYRDDDFFFTLIRYLSILSVRSPSRKNSDEPVFSACRTDDRA